ncbi:MAG: hypothetical protein A2664_04205 [Candidatus Taylorbacteria bacterium RIFCSPHIGHO2_01_FULL_46_22b]|uniref:Uncharacterized protein n=1 Tax=Candidatus Taylorbacteria bacterium RIFCSPHIGHO2_01_FULL_46_22b TaxID=1802301 RepID=A0A1G2M3U9_9BACT|nr:MAG: hypothetical protein A2664_04205 [Candidatus Taylorbacteria bacterium RIFCSPHIGHO2_01_FULL_46_22b]
MKKNILNIVALSSVIPTIAFAADFKSFVNTTLTSFSSVISALIAIAVFLLIFGIFRYITAGDNPERIAEGGKLLFWGLIAVFVMFSFWGLTRIILNTFFSAGDLTGFQLENRLFNTN